MRRVRQSVLAAACVLTLLASSISADGTIDIMIDPATGFTISDPGSYRLVEDVTMSANVIAIDINAHDVTIDLGGHTISAGGSTADGINGVAQDQVKIFNGRIRGFGANGIILRNAAIIEDVFVDGCEAWGISTGTDASILQCKAIGNNVSGNTGGILAGENSIIADCISRDNSPLSGTTWGIEVGEGSHVRNCIAEGNSSSDDEANGIRAFFGRAVISNCIARGNQGGGNTSGIRAGLESVIEKSNCSDNLSLQNAFGIFSVGGIIRANTCSRNMSLDDGSAYGIYALGAATIVNNTCSNNSEGPNGLDSSHGILAVGATVSGNTCSNNIADTDGHAYGIWATSSIVKSNYCSQNNAAGSGTGHGIFVLLSARVEGNSCVRQTGGTAAYGIFASGADNLIIGNTTAENGTAGTRLDSAGNRFQENMMADSTGLSAVGGNSIPAGGDPRENVAY